MLMACFLASSAGFSTPLAMFMVVQAALLCTNPASFFTNKKILVSDYNSQSEGGIKFYHYGGGKRFISLTDPVQELSYVFDGNGTLLTNPPLESTAIELRMANSDQSYVFFIHGKSLTIQPLNP